MSIIFHIPGPLREFTSGQSRVEVGSSPATAGEALSVLWMLYPGVRDRVANEQGQIREHINIFVGTENIRYTGGLATPTGPDEPDRGSRDRRSTATLVLPRRWLRKSYRRRSNLICG